MITTNDFRGRVWKLIFLATVSKIVFLLLESQLLSHVCEQADHYYIHWEKVLRTICGNAVVGM
jgi:hypothetical protein